jgi:hypothetical protein
VPWINGDEEGDNQDDDDDDDQIIDESGLFGSDDGSVEDGVTSGADPTSWDPINIDGNP